VSDEKKPPTLEDLVSRGAALRDESTWKPSQELLDAIADRNRLEALPDPAAPDPVVLVPEKGGRVLVAGEQAAEVYVPPTVPQPGLSPRMPTGPVKLRSDVDPRRQKTQPMLCLPAPMSAVEEATAEAAAAHVDAEARTDAEAELPPVFDIAEPPPESGVDTMRKLVRLPLDYSDHKSGEWEIPDAYARCLYDSTGVKEDVEAYRAMQPEKPAEAVASPPPAIEAPELRAGAKRAAAKHEEPPSTAPAAGPVSTRDNRKRGLMVGAAIVFVAGVVTALAVTRKPEPARELSASATAAQVTATVPASAAAALPSAPATSTSTAPSVEPTSTGTAASATAVPSVNPAPKATIDPYADAGAVPSATSLPSATPVVSAAPAASAAPSGLPAVSSTPSAVTTIAPAVSPTAKPSATPAPSPPTKPKVGRLSGSND